MKLIVEAIVAGKSRVLADGLVRVTVTTVTTVTESTESKVVGRLSLTAELWTKLRDWIIAAAGMGIIGAGMDMEIEVREREHSVGDGKRPETMRGRLLEAIGEAAEKRAGMAQDVAATGKATENQAETQDGQGAVKRGRVGVLWQQVQQAQTEIQKRRK